MIKLPVVNECLVCRTKVFKNEKGKKEEKQIPCSKVTDDNLCELYENPAVMWKKQGGCIFPGATSTVSDKFQEAGVRKFRR